MNRRKILTLLGSAAAFNVVTILGRATPAVAQSAPTFTLPPLGYAYEALEPHIDTATMKIHHDVHHAAYVNNLNALADKAPELKTKPMLEVLTSLGSIPDAVRTGVRNNLGGHFNHSFFWELMTPGGAKEPTADVKAALDGMLGGVDKMKDAVNAAGLGRFGSGWAWLVVDKDKKLAVINTPYQDTPHMDLAAKPVLGVDVWEHAYYLKYQAKRADYLKAWWNTVNWDKVAANFKAAMA